MPRPALILAGRLSPVSESINHRKLPTKVPYILIAAGLAVFFAKPFRTGWTTQTTDFPNYYTASVLVRAGKPLHLFYDWTWFQREMDLAGIKRQLGAYTPQTPLTMLPMIAFASAEPQNAKRIWLLLNLAFLATTIGILARLTDIRWDLITLLTLCGYGSLASNFVLGQYYVFLLFLLTLTYWCLIGGRDWRGGLMSGVTFGLKLYSGPLLFYYCAAKRWRSVVGMAVSLTAMITLALLLFGWSDVFQYATRVLPRTLEGGSIDPYNPGNPTLATLLRRTFVREPQLNPHALLDAPWLFFLLLSMTQLGLLVAAVLGIRSRGVLDSGRDFAWFVILLMLLSTSVGSYSFILLLLPVVVVLKDAAAWEKCVVVVSYVVLNAYIPPLWWFPKVCVLVALFIVIGRKQLTAIPARWWMRAAAVVVVLSAVSATLRIPAHDAEPELRYAQLPSGGAMLASYPTISRDGLFFQCMGRARYELCWAHDGRLERIPFEGDVLRPMAVGADGPLVFELVTTRASRTMRFDPATRALTETMTPAPVVEDAVSPDGRWIAHSVGLEGSRELWLENVTSGEKRRLAGGRCDNAHPAWELDSRALVFASDCGRAYGLPALYRAGTVD